MDLGKREGGGELGGVDGGETVVDMYCTREESIQIKTSQHRALTEINWLPKDGPSWTLSYRSLCLSLRIVLFLCQNSMLSFEIRQ